jgi:hypothetical protein
MLPITPSHKYVSKMWPYEEAQILGDNTSVLTVQKSVQHAIQNFVMPTYVYTYPLRQTYRSLPELNSDNDIIRVISKHYDSNESPDDFESVMQTTYEERFSFYRVTAPDQAQYMVFPVLLDEEAQRSS